MAPRTLNPCSYLPRRLQIVTSLVLFLLFSFIFLGSSPEPNEYVSRVPYGPELQQGAHDAVEHLPSIPNLPSMPKQLPHTPPWLNPFLGPAHKPPPEQANSTSGEAKWFSDWKWLQNPFSSSITLDEERSVLPPLGLRQPIYTYYDPAKKEDKVKKIELELLTIWRRAWWAKGFKPIVLGSPEAMNNPLYRTLQGLELEDEFAKELMRWLAWGNMGTGILCNYFAVPMAPWNEPLLTFLRRGEYPALTRFENTDTGLYVGSKDDIEKAISQALESKKIKEVKNIADAVDKKTFQVDPEPKSIAFYSTKNIMNKYPLVKEKLSDKTTKAEGLALLPSLINSHLHTTWQSQFSKGIEVLKPLPEHTSNIVDPAIDLARNLTQCPESPIPASCPPNIPKCKPCDSDHPLPLSLPPIFHNVSTLFTIATVPHPYTLNSLTSTRENIDIKYIRRETKRDSWIMQATKELLGNNISSYARLTSLKEAIASDHGASHSLWLTAERNNEVSKDDLDWVFGFALPRSAHGNDNDGKFSRPPAPKAEFGDRVLPPTEKEIKVEKALLAKAKEVVKGKAIALGAGAKAKMGGAKEATKVRDAVEAWNLADAEAWKFVRAFGARRRMERKKWEEEEEAFLGKGMFSRWVDKVI
ncbi:hypothetical protein MBLNU230_g8350t1 [Neophaeotheca triangularis]